MERSDSIAALAKALSLAQSKMAGAKKDANNPHYKSKYADLASVWDAARPALTEQGIAVMQFTIPSDKDEVIVETVLAHESGEWASGRIAIPVDKTNAHGYGSALTYGRRYGLAAAAGIAPEDDDGNAAKDAPPKKEVPKASARGVAVAAFEALDEGQKAALQSKADYIADMMAAKGPVECVNALHDMNLDNESKLALWSLLDSELRSTIKREEARRNNGATH